MAAFASCFFIGQSVGIAANGQLIALVGTTGIIVLGALGVWLVSWNFVRLLRTKRRHDLAECPGARTRFAGLGHCSHQSVRSASLIWVCR